MINGTPSKIIYFGAFGLLALCVIGILILSFNDKSTPSEISLIITALISFILGSHVKAPTMADPQTQVNADSISRIDSRIDRRINE